MILNRHFALRMQKMDHDPIIISSERKQGNMALIVTVGVCEANFDMCAMTFPHKTVTYTVIAFASLGVGCSHCSSAARTKESKLLMRLLREPLTPAEIFHLL